jgi:serine/threonine protein phosphatase PrpC
MGILQCTRAIGDKDLQSYGVIPTPDVLSLPRTGHEEFLVLATDGLWDVVSNEVRGKDQRRREHRLLLCTAVAKMQQCVWRWIVVMLMFECVKLAQRGAWGCRGGGRTGC